MTTGPLHGLRVLEIGGLGPGPFCAMFFADLGADVVRVDRPADQFRLVALDVDLLNRGKRSVLVDLKAAAGTETVLALAGRADLVIEGFRPGVADRLGVGPGPCMKRRPQLVYGRMTGWGQHGPFAHTAGHDINYIALSSALHAIGQSGGPPQIPLALVGDFTGGMYLAAGLLAALHEAQTSGQGQVVDAAVADSAAHLMTAFYGLLAAGGWKDERGVNTVDGGSPFYGVYETSDGKYMAVGAVEPKFFGNLLEVLGLDADRTDQFDPEAWPTLRQQIATAFASRTQDEWIKLAEGTDACVAPVLSMLQAPRHPHNMARSTFVVFEDVTQPAPAPRFSRTQPSLRGGPCAPGQHTEEVLADWLA